MNTRRSAPGLLTIASFVAVVSAVLALAACDSDTGRTVTADTPTTADTRAADEAAVRGLLDKINEAWARGDATAYASFHTPDADLIDFRGVHAVGRQGIVDLMQPAFDGVLRGSRVEAQIVDLRFLSATVAVFHSKGRIVPMGEDSIQTFIATRGPAGWLIAAFQNTRIQPAG